MNDVNNVPKQYLLPSSGSRLCVLSFAETERHSVTNWCSVALIGAMAGSMEKKIWNKFQRNGKSLGNQFKIILVWIIDNQRQTPAQAIMDFWLRLSNSTGQLVLIGSPIAPQNFAWRHHILDFCHYSFPPPLTRHQLRRKLKSHQQDLRNKIVNNLSPISQYKHNDATNLAECPWKHLPRRQKPPNWMWCAQTRNLFRNNPEHQKTLLQAKQQAPPKNPILKHYTSMMSSSCINAL